MHVESCIICLSGDWLVALSVSVRACICVFIYSYFKPVLVSESTSE